MTHASSSRFSSSQHSAAPDTANSAARKLAIEARFCPADVDKPFDTVEWESRTAVIKDETGALLFEQRDCQIPSTWSQLATNVVVNKYFYGEPGTSQRENSLAQLIHRVTRTIADWGIADGYFATAGDGERFYRDLTWLCLHQYGAFNSPVWFNVGLHQQYSVDATPSNWNWDEVTQTVVATSNPYERPQCSACFIQSVDDELEAIMQLAASEAKLFKFGSGTGTDLSTIRSAREKLAGGGRPSGPLSFMRVYDQIAGVVKSGGKTRRAAKMQSLKVQHPDIMEFIECKWKEEQKAYVLIERGGYDANFNGEAYSSIMFQNANLSVRFSDEYMQAYERGENWQTHWVTDPQELGPNYPARQLMDRVAECAWHCGDPGAQFDSTINRWHTCPESGRINASNPCSEYMFLDNSACNLASLNLMKFRQADGQFDVERFAAACRLFFIAQEILVDNSSYPTAEIAKNSHLFRPLGLGYTNLGSLLMANGLAYDSDTARGWCSAITAILNAAAYRTSAELAAARGSFTEYEKNRDAMLGVMEMHRAAVREIDPSAPGSLRAAAQELWDDVLRLGREHGYRNAQATVLAPTGTISFMMDCDTTGIEPDIALVKYKHLAGGGMMKIVNQTVRLALRTLGYESDATDRIIQWIDENDTIEGAADLRDEHLPIFDCAFRARNGQRSIVWQAHVAMMAAAQPFISGAISKTVNMPNNATPADIAEAYHWAWQLGLKALAIYRDGSKQSQPLATGKSEADTGVTAKPRRERLPDTRRSVTHKFEIVGHEGYITVGLYDDGRPGEVFITMAKEGSTVGGMMDSFGTAISISLQYGVPLGVLVNKFSHARFEPMGFTKNPEIRVAKSIVDYIFRWMALEFLPGYREQFTQAAREAEVADDEVPSALETPSNKLPDSEDTSGNELTTDTPQSDPGVQKTGGHAANSNHQASWDGSASVNGKASVRPSDVDYARFQADAPSCDQCGAITVRNGNCYLCYTCGNSMGCS